MGINVLCPCGAAICSSNSEVDLNGSVYFLNNKAQRGGAMCLWNSNMTVYQGFVSFHDDVADKGGAMYVYLPDSTICVDHSVSLEFVNNSALYDGGAVYFDFYPDPHLISYYYELLINANHFHNSAADGRSNLAYFDVESLDCVPNKTFKHKEFFSSSVCAAAIFDAKVKVDVSNQSNGVVHYWFDNLEFSAVILDYFNNFMGPVTVSLHGYCDAIDCFADNDSLLVVHNEFQDPSYIIDSIHNNVTLIPNNSIGRGCFNINDKSSMTLYMFYAGIQVGVVQVKVTVQRTDPETCNDIAHYADTDAYGCVPLMCSTLQHAVDTPDLLPPGFKCSEGFIAATPGYWYDNGLRHYVVSCPADYCNKDNWKLKIRYGVFPDRDLQCRDNWKGFSCGECNGSIAHDSVHCISSSKCLVSSVPLSVFLLFLFSFIYWCIVIALILTILQFSHNISAGYVFGIIFYYSILELVVSVFDEVVQARECATYEDHYIYVCDLNNLAPAYLSKTLSFCYSIGTSKPPFIHFLNLCLDRVEMIDHIALGYIHPLIVLCIAIIIFVSARKIACVRRYFGRSINSKSFCLLVLLAYSSISYTSVQLLRPLAYFKSHHDLWPVYRVGGDAEFAGWKSYWSPTIDYFHDHHQYYVILAILCEVVIGFGFPFFLLFQRYLTCHYNINFMSIRPIIDQLQSCYKDKCYWFSAYYLICRQVIYGIDIFCDFLLGFWMLKDEYTFAKFITLLAVCSVIMVVHIWFQPYRLRSINLLDGAILLSLLLLLISSLDGNGWRCSPTFWILPLVLFINCLAYSTKIQHVVVLSSVFGLIFVVNMTALWPQIPIIYIDNRLRMGITFILFLTVLACFFVTYILYVIKNVVKSVIKNFNRPNDEVIPLVADGVQNNSDEDDSD